MSQHAQPNAVRQTPTGLRASLRNLASFKRNPLQLYRQLSFDGQGQYQTTAYFDLFGANYLINDPTHVGQILTAGIDHGAYTKEGLRFFLVMRRLLNLGIFTSEGAFHLAQRQLLQPTFQPGSMTALAAQLADAALAVRQRWATQADQVLNVEHEMLQLSLDLLATALVGGDLRAEVQRFGAYNEAAEAALIQVMGSPVLWPAWVPTASNRMLKTAARQMHETVRQLIARRRPGPGSAHGAPALLSQLFTHEGTMGPAQFQDEVATLLVGGYKSTAQALNWTWYLLATNPDAARRLRAELDAVLAGRPPEAGDLPRLTYTRMVIQEALRLYPPVWAINRIATRQEQLGDVTIPAGAIITISPYTVHRNPHYWEQPEAFYPEHFAQGQVRPPHAYIPFGAGRHKCLGNYYALSAVTSVVATLVQHFAFDPPAHPVEPNTRAFTYPEHGLHMRLRRRDERGR